MVVQINENASSRSLNEITEEMFPNAGNDSTNKLRAEANQWGTWLTSTDTFPQHL